ncbi:MAG: ATP-binding cassette domain-containing protein [Actinobacteria bacterium]|nr:ATP-binding cassette domain-containing protein [Actinomycetota bacterium]
MTVEVLRVTFTYPGASKPALENVSLSIPEGCFALVVGATGSGKSTLLRTMNGLVPHFSGGTFSGYVHVRGRSTLEHVPRELADVVAFVPQEPARSFVLDKVEEELAYAMENLALEPQVMRRRIEETLDLLDIERLRDRSVSSLSGGEKQRVAIAAALTPGARVLLLDEPTSQLDPQGAEDVLAALHRLVHELGITVVAAEHRLERVVSFADTVVTCDAGRADVATPRDALRASDLAPPVTKVGRLLGWTEVPLTVRDARSSARELRLQDPVHRQRRDAPDPLITARDLSAGYGDKDVLDAVTIAVGAGELVGLMGRNGAGKTTLLRCLAGIHAPSGGTVAVDGRRPEPGYDVGLCPQSPEDLLFADTVEAEISASVRATRRGIDVDGVLREMDLDRLRDRHPRDLSAGERLLTAIAAITATGARVLLLDEPTRGLDANAKEKLRSVLRTFARNGTAIVFATHDVEFVAALATRVVMLAGGAVISDGTPVDVLGDSAVFSPQMTRVFGPGWLTPDQVVEAALA